MLHKQGKSEKQHEKTLVIDKIINHKVVDGKTLFLVKWKDPSEGEDWIDETKFNTKECINKYWKSKSNITPRIQYYCCYFSHSYYV